MKPLRLVSHVTLVSLGVIALFGGGTPCVQAEDRYPNDTSADVTVEKVSERLRFKVPPDWPIEKRGGVMAPIPIEEYLARKFKALEGSIQSIEQRVNGLDLRMRVVEQESKKIQQGLRAAAPPNPQ